MEELFGGWSLAADRPLPGAWRNPTSGEVEYDESWRYEVGVPPDRLDEFDEYLARLADRLASISTVRSSANARALRVFGGAPGGGYRSRMIRFLL